MVYLEPSECVLLLNLNTKIEAFGNTADWRGTSPLAICGYL